MPSTLARRSRAVALAASAALALSPLALAPSASAVEAKPLPSDTHFFTPLPDPGAVKQIADLARHRDLTDAYLVGREITTPQAVWFTKGTPAQVKADVHKTVVAAAVTHTVPTLVAYDVPNRDCGQYSAGGAADDAAYQRWVNGFASGLVPGQRVAVILEPDGLGLLPSDCLAKDPHIYDSLPTPPTDASREALLHSAGLAIEAADPQALVYLDSTHNGWLNVGDAASRLAAAGVADFQGFFLNISNYQWTADLEQYGTWVSDCLASGDYANCPNQYWNGGPSNNWTGVALDPLKQWSDAAADATANTKGINERYASMNLTPTAHFVIDTSRNGQGPWAPAAGTSYPDKQDWCNPPGRGLGARPQGSPDAADALLDAYLWVKTPGQSDGQCNRGIAGSTTDPEWGGISDPAAGAWFPQQALQLAQLAAPSFLH
jgi:endoglucanase